MLDEPYPLSVEELAILRPALTDALAGQNLISLDACDVISRRKIKEWQM